MLTVGIVLEALSGKKVEGALQPIHGGALDSREVSPGSLFVAIKGEKADGHDFVVEAFESGATVVLVERHVDAGVETIDSRKPGWFEDLGTIAPSLQIVVDDSVSALQTIAKFWRAQLDLRVIGITGSVGKSTTKELTAEILGRRFRTLKNPGT